MRARRKDRSSPPHGQPSSSSVRRSSWLQIMLKPGFLRVFQKMMVQIKGCKATLVFLGMLLMQSVGRRSIARSQSTPRSLSVLVFVPSRQRRKSTTRVLSRKRSQPRSCISSRVLVILLRSGMPPAAAHGDPRPVSVLAGPRRRGWPIRAFSNACLRRVDRRVQERTFTCARIPQEFTGGSAWFLWTCGRLHR